jgi:Zn-dependent protease
VRIRILTVAGIPVYVHGALVLLLAALLVFLRIHLEAWGAALKLWSSAVLALGGVFVHECGHALAAKRIGVPVTDIVLNVFFGMTRMAPPTSPREELIIGCAGPLSNLAIALPLGAWIHLAGEGFPSDPTRPLAAAFVVNAFLGVLNLAPAFPMDGGRMLRALLSIRLGHARATAIALNLGRLLAAGLILSPLVLGFEGVAPILPVVGIVLLALGEAEARRAAVRNEEKRVALFLHQQQQRAPTPSEPPAAAAPPIGADPAKAAADAASTSLPPG